MTTPVILNDLEQREDRRRTLSLR